MCNYVKEMSGQLNRLRCPVSVLVRGTALISKVIRIRRTTAERDYRSRARSRRCRAALSSRLALITEQVVIRSPAG